MFGRWRYRGDFGAQKAQIPVRSTKTASQIAVSSALDDKQLETTTSWWETTTRDDVTKEEEE